MNSMIKLVIAFLTTLYLAMGASKTQDWANWRGPDQNGIAAEGNYPSKVSIEDNILWEAELPGKGGSTPIVWNDHIILTSGIGEGEEGEDGVLCFDWSGNLLWQVSLGTQVPGKHPRGSGSNSSAVTDGERIFVLFKSTTIAALDFEGKVLWEKNLQDEYGELTYWWDFGTSSVLAEGNVVTAIQHEGESYLLALDKTSGKEAWKIDRTYECKPESAQSYTTPLVVKDGNQTTIIVWGADHLTGHNAKTGQLMWSYSGFNPDQKQYWRTIASAAIYDDIAVVPYGRGRFLAGVKINKEGDMTENDWLWELKGTGTDVATPVISNGRAYGVSFGGDLWCVDILSGQEIWQEKLPEVKGVFYSSPTLAGNNLYLCSDEGSFYVCEITDTGYQVITHTKFDDNFVATPVLVQDKLLLRGTKKIYCIGQE